jgi:hypothetical protein
VAVNDFCDYFAQGGYCEAQDKIEAVQWWRRILKRGVAIQSFQALRALPETGNTTTSVCKKQVDVLGEDLLVIGYRARNGTRIWRLNDDELRSLLEGQITRVSLEQRRVQWIVWGSNSGMGE